MNTNKKASKAQYSKMDILDHIENIIDIVKKTGLDKPGEKLKKHSDYVSKKLDITPLMAILFSFFVEKNSDSAISIDSLAKSIGCNNIKILKYSKEFDALEQRKLIRCRRKQDDITYRVPHEVCESLKKNTEYKAAVNENLSIQELFVVLSDIFEERENNELSYETLAIELMELINLNKHLSFCKRVLNYNLDDHDFVLLLLFCHLSGNNDDDYIRRHDYEFIFDDKFWSKRISSMLSNEDHVLFGLKLIEHNNENGFVDSNSLKLTDKAKKELLFELCVNNKKDSEKCLTKFDSIKPKDLYYNKKETEAVMSLTSLLPGKSKSIQLLTARILR